MDLNYNVHDLKTIMCMDLKTIMCMDLKTIMCTGLKTVMCTGLKTVMCMDLKTIMCTGLKAIRPTTLHTGSTCLTGQSAPTSQPPRHLRHRTTRKKTWWINDDYHGFPRTLFYWPPAQHAATSDHCWLWVLLKNCRCCDEKQSTCEGFNDAFFCSLSFYVFNQYLSFRV